MPKQTAKTAMEGSRKRGRPRKRWKKKTKLKKT
jgi:hypothetical protein